MARQLAEAFPPGEFLAEELQTRHWSQTDFAQILGRPAQFVSEIVAGKKEITRESAAQIGAALDTPPEYWLNLQNAYLLWSQSQSTESRQELEGVRQRARMNKLAPVTLLRKRGLITGDTVAEQEAQILELFQIQSLDEDPKFLAAARRSNRDEGPTPTQKAWLACARQKAQRVKAAKYDKNKLEQLASELSRIVAEPEQFQGLPERFAAVGVRLVYIEAFPGSKLNGASFLLDDDPEQPVIALSGRGKRLDGVLFTLLHEVAHIILGHVSTDQLFIDEGVGQADEPQEQEADRQAGEWQIPGGLPKPPRVIRKGWIQTAAQQVGVHPVVILGRLQIDKLLEWRTALAKDAPTVDSYLEHWN
ncbi:HigA family addiction module antitoxin [Arthrobacter tumbae]|uniref:HigA family addiction module antitoxin n=1 Tax=Arthrobacter tumbae TaxID=163874 RepID=UPI0019597605|nr:HigA family addiction module antitoxin [Arthrobacter tumbae]MBM7781845.1 HTH-type transcriptional regulator/antitoxin HigA [Arthrobacter tumbae]